MKIKNNNIQFNSKVEYKNNTFYNLTSIQNELFIKDYSHFINTKITHICDLQSVSNI